MNAREEAVRCLIEGRTVKRGPAAVEYARDLASGVCARAVLRHDWQAASVYAQAHELLTVLHERAWQVRDARRAAS